MRPPAAALQHCSAGPPSLSLFVTLSWANPTSSSTIQPSALRHLPPTPTHLAAVNSPQPKPTIIHSQTVIAPTQCSHIPLRETPRQDDRRLLPNPDNFSKTLSQAHDLQTRASGGPTRHTVVGTPAPPRPASLPFWPLPLRSTVVNIRAPSQIFRLFDPRHCRARPFPETQRGEAQPVPGWRLEPPSVGWRRDTLDNKHRHPRAARPQAETLHPLWPILSPRAP